MGFIDSYDLGKGAKTIIADILSGSSNYETLLKSDKGLFYKKEILAYLAYSSDAGDCSSQDFVKVLDRVSFDLEKIENSDIVLLDMLANHKELSASILYILSENNEKVCKVSNVALLNKAARAGALDEQKHRALLKPILDESIADKALFKSVTDEIKNFGINCPVTKRLLSEYLNHHKIKPTATEEVLDLVSRQAKADGEKENLKKELIDCINEESKQATPGGRFDFSVSSRSALFSMLDKKPLDLFANVNVIDAFDKLVNIYYDKPKYQSLLLESLESLKKSKHTKTFLKRFLVSAPTEKGFATHLFAAAKQNKNDLDLLQASELMTYTFLEDYSEREEVVSFLGSMIRKEDSSYKLGQVFDRIGCYCVDDTKPAQTDFNNQAFQFLLHTAVNDSRMSAAETAGFCNDIMKKSISSKTGGRETCSALILSKILASGDILKQDKDLYSNMMADIKTITLFMSYPEGVNKKFDSILLKNAENISPEAFACALLDKAFTYEKHYNISPAFYESDKKPEEVLNKTVEVVENILKSNKLEPEQKHKISKRLDSARRNSKQISIDLCNRYKDR